MEQPRPNKPLLFFIAFIALALIILFLLIKQCTGGNTTKTVKGTSSNTENIANNGEPLTITGNHTENYDTALSDSPEALIHKVHSLMVKANETKDINPLINLIGKGALTENQAMRLQELARMSQLKLNSTTPYSAVKDLEGRWALNLEGNGPILLDLAKNPDAKWQVNRIKLPAKNGAITTPPTAGGNAGIPTPTPDQANAGNGNAIPNPADANAANGNANPTPANEVTAATTVEGFMTAIQKLDPTSARQFIDSDKISYAKIAGLCIIFEEGKYKLAEKRAIRQMFLKENSAGWLTAVNSDNSKTNSLLGIVTKRENMQAPWEITEVNLDKLLADYANRFSDGDIHYTPLIQNPKGGDTLAIYFDLDSENLTTRTQRQLSIVANLLKNNNEKKMTISGHTDALGSKEHNMQLSQKRANSVMKFLTQQGVASSQIDVTGYGKSQPRRPNTTANGADAPNGRRANRRAEIILSF